MYLVIGNTFTSRVCAAVVRCDDIIVYSYLDRKRHASLSENVHRHRFVIDKRAGEIIRPAITTITSIYISAYVEYATR